MNTDFEPVESVDDYYDGPRAGIANFRGQPHAYRSLYLDSSEWNPDEDRFELTPLKSGCLTRCRSPAEFLTRHWRPGWSGAMRLGALHGADCLGCCWILMGLLFVGGLMNLFWVATIAAFILLEKTLPLADTGARVVGAALIVGGLLSMSGLVPLG